MAGPAPSGRHAHPVQPGPALRTNRVAAGPQVQAAGRTGARPGLLAAAGGGWMAGCAAADPGRRPSAGARPDRGPPARLEARHLPGAQGRGVVAADPRARWPPADGGGCGAVPGRALGLPMYAGERFNGYSHLLGLLLAVLGT